MIRTLCLALILAVIAPGLTDAVVDNKALEAKAQAEAVDAHARDDEVSSRVLEYSIKRFKFVTN